MAGYRIDGVLGEGAMSVVYRATQLSLNRVVALKLLSPELSGDAGFASYVCSTVSIRWRAAMRSSIGGCVSKR